MISIGIFAAIYVRFVEIRYVDTAEELGCSPEHGKVLRRFCTVEHSSIQRSRAFAFFFFFYSWSLSLSRSIPASVMVVERDGDALFPPPSRSFHLFRSRHCMPRGDELSLSPTFSIYLLPTVPLFLPSSLSPLLFMADPSVGRIDSTLSRRIREYAFNAERRRIYSPAYFPHFYEWHAASHATLSECRVVRMIFHQQFTKRHISLLQRENLKHRQGSIARV